MFLFAFLAFPVLFEAKFILGLWLKEVPEYTTAFCQIIVLVENERRNALELDRILDRLDITENEARQYREQGTQKNLTRR